MDNLVKKINRLIAQAQRDAETPAALESDLAGVLYCTSKMAAKLAKGRHDVCYWQRLEMMANAAEKRSAGFFGGAYGLPGSNENPISPNVIDGGIIPEDQARQEGVFVDGQHKKDSGDDESELDLTPSFDL